MPTFIFYIISGAFNGILIDLLSHLFIYLFLALAVSVLHGLLHPNPKLVYLDLFTKDFDCIVETKWYKPYLLKRNVKCFIVIDDFTRTSIRILHMHTDGNLQYHQKCVMKMKMPILQYQTVPL